MKVTIGSYPHRLVCDLHTNHMRKKYGFDWPEPTRFDNLVEEIEDSIQSVYDVFNWIWFDRRTQQIKVRIDKSDTWSMDHTLGHIILPMLVQLKATKHGAPCTDDKDVPEELRQAIGGPLNTINWGTDDWEGDFYEYRELGPEEDKGDSRFGFKLVWEDKEGRKAHAARMANGFILFGKYYENLWD
jgi:hypothetical protein